MPIAWDAAFATIAAALNALASPDEAIFYTSGRTSNEAAFLYQLFVREFGTNNLPDCSNMCHEASGVAMTEQIGSGKGSVTLDDFELADAIFIFGQNPGTNHPRMLGELRSAAKRGAASSRSIRCASAGWSASPTRKSPADLLGGGVRRSPRTTSSRASAATSRWRRRWRRCVIERDAVDRDFVARPLPRLRRVRRGDAGRGLGRHRSASPA